MSQLIRFVLIGCGLIVALAWLKQELLQGTFNTDGVPTALFIGLLGTGSLFCLGLLARALGLGSAADPDHRRREARLRTTVRRPVDTARARGWEPHDFGGIEADEEGVENEVRR